jgi:hypothetical protein
MIDLIREALKSPAGSFSFILSLMILAFWLTHFVTKKITEINSGHSTLDKSVNKIETHIDEIRKDMSFLKGSIEVLRRGADPVVQSHSPVSLTESGKTMAKEFNAEKMIAHNWENIFADLEKNICDKNAYDIQQYCIETASVEPDRFLESSDLNKMKEYAYLNGNPLQYYMPIFGVLIRDKYLQIKGIKVSEIDKYDPNKK